MSILYECNGERKLYCINAISLKFYLFIIVKALCVLVNLSSGCTRSRDRIAESDLVVQCLVQLLVRHLKIITYMIYNYIMHVYMI